jgi:hypothetical protein
VGGADDKDCKMTENEIKLASYFLELASEEFGNHGCNDVDESVFESWSLDERRNFVKEFHEYNGDPNEYDENFLHLPDFCIMSFLAHKIKEK